MVFLVLEVGALREEHREEEHASHMRVMRLSMLLQRHLEDEVHDVAVLTTYRAWLMRAVGDYQLRVITRAANCSACFFDLAEPRPMNVFCTKTSTVKMPSTCAATR